jgi:hypothetical protein
MYFCTAWQHRNMLVRFVVSTAFQSASGSLNSRLSRVMPALFTRMSIRPHRCATSSAIAVTAAESVTSQPTASARPPSDVIFSTTEAQRSAVRSTTATLAPPAARVAAVAAPIP